MSGLPTGEDHVVANSHIYHRFTEHFVLRNVSVAELLLWQAGKYGVRVPALAREQTHKARNDLIGCDRAFP